MELFTSVILITRSDGLDPTFSHLDGLMVVGRDLVIFVVQCQVQLLSCLC